MNLKEHLTKNRNWWYIIIMISLVICTLFPVQYYENESRTYNIIVSGIGFIIGGGVVFLFPYLVSIFIKRRLNEKQIKITLIICFSFWWLLQIINHFGKGLINSSS